MTFQKSKGRSAGEWHRARTYINSASLVINDGGTRIAPSASHTASSFALRVFRGATWCCTFVRRARQGFCVPRAHREMMTIIIMTTRAQGCRAAPRAQPGLGGAETKKSQAAGDDFSTWRFCFSLLFARGQEIGSGCRIGLMVHGAGWTKKMCGAGTTGCAFRGKNRQIVMFMCQQMERRGGWRAADAIK